MNRESYEDMLVGLGYNPAYFNRGSLLRHDSNRRLPRVYFNNKRNGFVFFTVRHEESHHFPKTLWQRINHQQKADSGPVHMTVIPVRGKEVAAFTDLKTQKLMVSARYRT